MTAISQAKVDYGTYMASREWRLKRKEVIERAEGWCERCRDAKLRDVHHLTYERLGHENPEDLQGLCRPCHEFMSAEREDDPRVAAVLAPPLSQGNEGQALRCADLFSGIGGFHIAATNLGLEVVFACDIDDDARATYRRNFGLEPEGDITRIRAEDIPDHELLFAGFPCQPFSIIGNKQGFSDPRGTLWFEVARIIRAKRPGGIVLENVKQLATADKGKVLQRILDDLTDIGYTTDYRILNAVHFGLPQKRERTIIVATLAKFSAFPWPTEKLPMTPLSEVLEDSPDTRHFVSERIREKRREAHIPAVSPSIWHENKAGHISSYPYSCALRAGASHNYLLVNGERRLTPRELLRLQGFPDDFEIVSTDAQVRKQAGNAVPVPVVQAVIEGVISVLERSNETARVGAKA